MKNMEETNMSYNKTSSNKPRVITKARRRRRSHSRKALSNCIINFAEARKEVANALHQHRSSLKKATPQCSSSLQRELGLQHNLMSSQKSHHYPMNVHKMGSFSTSTIFGKKEGYSPFLEAQVQGVEGPTWSTTGPSVLSSPTSILEAIRFDDWVIYHHDESNFAASYSWWVGFLESLDVNSQQESQEQKLDNWASNSTQDRCYDMSLNEPNLSSGSSEESLDIPHPDDYEQLLNDVLN